MLTDAILKESMVELERFLLLSVPVDGEAHVFSERFERKMQKLIRKANHPIRYKVLRAAAAIALAIVTLFGAVMASSPKARAAIKNWYKKTYGIYTHYNSSNKVQDEMKYTYRLSEIPAGYREFNVYEMPHGKIYIYTNDAGQLLRFAYSDSNSDGVFEETKNYEKYSAVVGKRPADVYIAPNNNETSVIIWWDDETGVLFRIAAYADRDELIKLAETVIKVE